MSRRPGHFPQAPVTPASVGAARWPTDWWCCALIFFAILVAYLPAFSGGFIWDDSGHVTRTDLRDLSGLFRIWFEFGATQQYYPVLHSAFWLEHLCWGDSTFAYHLLNVLLHATAACLFGLLLRRLAVPGAWLAAGLFALHPVGVESVAWISEQKNTLSTILYLTAALAYLRFNTQRRAIDYALALGLFFAALLTKTVTASLPAALLVVFWWQHGRLNWRRDVMPLLPWFALAMGSGLVTAYFERELIGAQGADFDLNIVQRGLLAGRVFWFYLGKLAWPTELIFIYPRWTIDPALLWQWLFPLGALATLAGLMGWSRRQRGPLAAALLFAGTLFPVLGFINVFPFLYSYVADHFQYLASLPIFALAAAGLTQTFVRLPRWGGAVGVAALLATLGALTCAQSRIYHNLFTLYETTLARNPVCWMAHNNLALALAGSNRVAEAVPHLEAAIRLKPDYAPAENNLGDLLLQLNRETEALPHFQRAVQLHPNYPVALRNLGIALATAGKTAEAIPYFEQALALNPTYAEAELSLGIALMLTNRFPAAVPHFERAIALDPEGSEPPFTYGRALMQAGHFEDAIPQFERVLRLSPDHAEGHLNLALALRQLGRKQSALEHYEEAIRLNPALAAPK